MVSTQRVDWSMRLGTAWSVLKEWTGLGGRDGMVSMVMWVSPVGRPGMSS